MRTQPTICSNRQAFGSAVKVVKQQQDQVRFTNDGER